MNLCQRENLFLPTELIYNYSEQRPFAQFEAVDEKRTYDCRSFDW